MQQENNKRQVEKIKTFLDKTVDDQRFVISIDGPCGSGKTTIAEMIGEEKTFNIVHMDDFYLPFADRDKNWMNEIAGHMDFSRLVDKVLKPYKEGRKIEYISYDCHSDKYLQEIEINLAKPLILEGSYSSHPFIDQYVDYKVFIEIDSETQKERLTKRNPKLVDKFISMWIPFENNYFNTLEIQKHCDLVFNVYG